MNGNKRRPNISLCTFLGTRTKWGTNTVMRTMNEGYKNKYKLFSWVFLAFMQKIHFPFMRRHSRRLRRSMPPAVAVHFFFFYRGFFCHFLHFSARKILENCVYVYVIWKTKNSSVAFRLEVIKSNLYVSRFAEFAASRTTWNLPLQCNRQSANALFLFYTFDFVVSAARL